MIGCFSLTYLIETEYFWVWSNKTSNLDDLCWALGNYSEHKQDKNTEISC